MQVLHYWHKQFYYYSKWLELSSISSLYSEIFGVREVLKRTVVGDWRFHNLSKMSFSGLFGKPWQQQSTNTCQQIHEPTFAQSHDYKDFDEIGDTPNYTQFNCYVIITSLV